MRKAVLTDIHANLEALIAVLQDVETQEVDEIILLGDLVGYGPDPGPVLDILMHLPNSRAIKGNNDVGCYDDAFFNDPANFNRYAQPAMAWTREQLAEQHRDWLRQLDHKVYIAYGIVGVHATLNAPEEFDYIFYEREHGARLVVTENLAATFAVMDALAAKICVIGHSHVPVVFAPDGSFVTMNFGELNEFSVSHYSRRVVACAGAVGQPRGVRPSDDGTPASDAYKACYAIIDDDFITFRRVDYDIETTVRKIGGNPDIPDWLGERLISGE